MRTLVTSEDAMGRRTDFLSAPDTVKAVVLTAGASRLVPVPASARRVLAGATGNFWMAYGRAAVLPTADVTDGSAPELNPAARDLSGVTTLGLVAPADCVVCLAFFG